MGEGKGKMTMMTQSPDSRVSWDTNVLVIFQRGPTGQTHSLVLALFLVHALWEKLDT